MYEDNLVKMTAERLRSDLLTKLLWSLVPVRLVEGPGKLSLSGDHSCMGGGGRREEGNMCCGGRSGGEKS